MNVSDRRILGTGGTGSLGQVLVRRLLSGGFGTPESVIVFSRDEAKQHAMRLRFNQLGPSTDEVETLISDEERHRTISRGNYFAIRPMLPELQDGGTYELAGLKGEYSSSEGLLSVSEIRKLLEKSGFTRAETSQEAGVR